MKSTLIKLLAAMGKPVAADATDETITAAAAAACPALATANAAETQLAAAQTEKADLTTKLTAAQADKATLEAEKLALVNAKTTAETECATLKTSLATERKERATLLANGAVTDGRLPAAERDATVTALCNAADFAAEAAKLAARQKALSTESKAKQLGQQRGPEGSRASQVIALVNAHMDTAHCDYETAFAAVQSDTKNAAIFAAMQPAKK